MITAGQAVRATGESLGAALSRLGASSPSDAAWRPILLDLANVEDRARLEDLIATGEIQIVHDTIREQLAELIETRTPGASLTVEDVRRRAEAHRGTTPWRNYGSQVYYPWSRRLTQVLPEAEYRELRTSRNRNKITAKEQVRLADLTIGVVGLSVGQASAVTLAMEGVGGAFVLADFDGLSLSNLNRLRAGTHAIGVNKAVLTARAIFEIDPYARVEIFTEGVTDDNLDDFLRPGGGAVDVVVEECDDFYTKLRVREAARALGIPVVMETSDRGMIDIERFDLEPERPLFHGVMQDLSADRFRGLGIREKSALALELIGGQDISPRLAASGIELQQSLSTWPQLASAVALGGAVNTDVVRRIALGHLRASGRYYVDLDRLVVDGSAAPLTTARDVEAVLPEAMGAPVLPGLAPTHAHELTEEHARKLVAHAVMAPSGGNAQPWRFVFRNNRIEVFLAPERSAAFLDFKHLASHLALGAVATNLELAAAELGFATRLERATEARTEGPVFTAHFARSVVLPGRSSSLFAQIPFRATNRKVGLRVALAKGDSAYLEEMAAEGGATLRLLTETDQLTAVANILGPVDRLRFMSKRMHADLVDEVRWTAEDARATRDGLDVATLELSAMDRAGLKLASAAGVMDLVAQVGGGRSLERPTRVAVETSSAVGLLTVPGPLGHHAMLAGGRALQRLWLGATARGYSFQPLTSVVCLFWRLHHGGEGLSRDERDSLEALRRPFDALFGTPQDHSAVMLFRVARCDAPTARSLRRHVDDVLIVR